MFSLRVLSGIKGVAASAYYVIEVASASLSVGSVRSMESYIVAIIQGSMVRS